MFAPEEFRRGLLAGLFDTDGSIAISHAKNKPQWIINYSTTSIRLAREITMLFKSLSIRASINAAKTPAGLPNWVVTPSSVELRKLKQLPCAHTEKVKRFAEYFAEPSNEDAPSYVRTDIVPIPRRIAEKIATQYVSSSSMYMMFRKAVHAGYTTRTTAKRALNDKPQLREDEALTRWISFVEDELLCWDRVLSYNVTETRETGYDLSVPGSETFMSVDGVVLSNTVQVHAPVTPGGIADVKRMTLSNLIFNDRKPGMLNVAPDMEAIIGLHRATSAGEKTKVKHFATKEDALAAYHRGEIGLQDNVEIKQ
jgi:replicative DNA helicase